MAGLVSAGAAALAAGLGFWAVAGITPWNAAAAGALVLLLISVCFYAGASLSAGGARYDRSELEQNERMIVRIRTLSLLGAVFGTVALALVVVFVGGRLFVPEPEQAVVVQFSDLEGRVQLEYCPSLPSSFEATATAADLAGNEPTIPLSVTASVCGDDSLRDGVVLYLDRSAITIAVTHPR